MKQMFVGSVLIMISIVLAIGQAVDAVRKAPETSVDELILLRMEREWNDALQERKIDWIEQNLAGDMTDISSGDGRLRTKAEEIEGMKADKTSYESLEFSNLKARVEGNAGVVTGVNRIKARDEDGKMLDVKFAFTDTYIKRDGRWQVWASQHTRVIP